MDLVLTHKKLLQLTKAFNETCKKAGANYTLHGGSLLGAIREQGFIPWDDDVDTAMTRTDYNKLVSFLESNDTDFFVRGLVKKQFCSKKEPTFWVDIFICDYISSGLLSKIKLLLLTFLDIMNRDKNSVQLSDFSKYGLKKKFAFKLTYLFGRFFPRKLKGFLYTFVSEKCFLGDKTAMFRSNDQLAGRGKIFPKVWMEEFVDVTFESERFFVCKSYDALLISCYGKNYMTPIKDVRNQNVHDIVRQGGDCL